MNNREFKMLCLFDYNCRTGFATVSHNIMDRLRRHFPNLILDIVAINYIENDPDGNPHPGKPYYLDVLKRQAVRPAIQEDSNSVDPLGRHEFLRLLRENNYNIVFVIQDPGVMAGRMDEHGNKRGDLFAELKKIREQKKKNGIKNFKLVYYFPIDGEPLEEWFNNFDVVDVPVAYTQYGKDEVELCRRDLGSKIKVIPHGINLRHFYPLESQEIIDFRKAYFEEHSDKVIWANINRNQTRKCIQDTIFSYEQFIKECPEERHFLYLHMHPYDPQGWDLRTLLKQTSLVEGEDYMFQKMESRDISNEYLNRIYNSVDFYITTTSGEGWGLTVTEAMACKIPVIAPLHTSLMEISGHGDRCWTIAALRDYVSHFDNMIRQSTDYKYVPKIMRAAYEQKELTMEKVQQAYKYTRTLDWDIVCKRWIEIFEKLL